MMKPIPTMKLTLDQWALVGAEIGIIRNELVAEMRAGTGENRRADVMYGALALAVDLAERLHGEINFRLENKDQIGASETIEISHAGLKILDVFADRFQPFNSYSRFAVWNAVRALVKAERD